MVTVEEMIATSASLARVRSSGVVIHPAIHSVKTGRPTIPPVLTVGRVSIRKIRGFERVRGEMDTPMGKAAEGRGETVVSCPATSTRSGSLNRARETEPKGAPVVVRWTEVRGAMLFLRAVMVAMEGPVDWMEATVATAAREAWKGEMAVQEVGATEPEMVALVEMEAA
jgi:hypothetical protein